MDSSISGLVLGTNPIESRPVLDKQRGNFELLSIWLRVRALSGVSSTYNVLPTVMPPGTIAGHIKYCKK